MSGKAFEVGIVVRADGTAAVTTFKQLGTEGKAAGEKIAEGSRTGAQASAALAAQLDATTKKQDQYAISSKQMQAAMRGVPAQFTDIFTSIQAGQNPMQVLLQQGGQLKDMFGGIGPAARALGGYMAGLVTTTTASAAAVVGLAVAYESGRRESEDMSRAVILTGNAAGTTVGKMQAYARSVSDATGATRGLAADALTQLTATGKVANDMLDRTAAAAVRLQRAGGPAIDETVARFAELGKAPLDASLKLNDQTNYLTAAVYLQIAALVDQNKMVEAAALAQGAYADALAQRTPEMEKNIGNLERAWRGVRDMVLHVGSAMKEIGREESTAEQIAALEQKAAPGRGIFAGLSKDEEAELSRLRLKLAAEEKAAEAAKASAVQTKAVAEFRAEGLKLLNREAQMEREITRQRQLGIDAGHTEKEIQERIAAIKEKFTDKRPSAKTALQKMLELGQKNELDAYYESGGEETMRIVAEKRAVASALKEKAQAEKDAAEAAKIHSGYIQSQIAPLEEHARKLEDEVATYGMSASRIEAVSLARLQEARDIAAANGAFPEHLAFLDREIEARQRLVVAAGSKEALDANKRATEEMQRDWERMHEQLSQSLTDQLMKGGQDAGELLENYFKTLVLRPVIQGAVNIGMNAVGSALGFSGAGNAGGAAGGGGGAMNLLSNGSSLYSLASGGGLFGGFSMGAASAASELALGAAFVGPSASLAGGAIGAGATAGLATGSAGLAGAMSTIGAALPWIGGAIAVGSMLGLFDGGGDDPHNNAQVSGFELGLARPGVFAVPNSDATGAPSSMTAGPTSGAGWWADSANLSAAQVAEINRQIAVTFDQGGALARVLGVDPSVIDGASVDSRYNGSPSNGAIGGYFATMEQAFAALGDAIAIKVIPNLDEFQQSGESLAQTAARLSQEFALTNKMATLMGRDAATAFGGNNLKARDALIQSLGGLGGASSTFDAYYKNFHSETERRADTTGNIAATLRAIGIADVPTTRDQYRALVEGQDLTTESGRTMYATLLSVADAFAGITESADAAARAMGTDRFRTRADYRFAQRTGVLPAYAGGGDHDGGWAVVGEVGPEVAWMPPSRIYSNADSKSLLDLSQVTQAIDSLRTDLRAANAALARAAIKTAKTLDKWDGDGMPLARTA